MKCLHCGEQDFEIQNIRYAPVVKDQTIEVICPTHVCKACGTSLMDTEQVNLMRRAGADQYRLENNLLTSEQINHYRTALNMSQSSFARYLQVGEASIKRWESASIQDESQDDHIRVKCDLDEAEKNYFFLLARLEPIDLYNGSRKFSAEAFDNVSNFFLSVFFPLDNKYLLNQLHFYSDFLNFKRHNRSITGIKYVSLRHGPSPCRLKMFTREPYKLVKPPTLTLKFDDAESRTLQDISNHFRRLGSKAFSEMCMKEKACLDTVDEAFISYKYAENLLIS